MSATATLAIAKRRVPALLAGTALAAALAPPSDAAPADLGVSIVIQPRCAVSSPSRLEPVRRAGGSEAKAADLLQVACTNGASWSVLPDERQEEGGRPKQASSSQDTDGESSRVVRITVRY